MKWQGKYVLMWNLGVLKKISRKFKKIEKTNILEISCVQKRKFEKIKK